MLRFDTGSFLCANKRLLLLTQAAELLQNVMSIESLADAKVWRLPSPSAQQHMVCLRRVCLITAGGLAARLSRHSCC